MRIASSLSSFRKIVNDCFRAQGLRPGPSNWKKEVNVLRWAVPFLQSSSMRIASSLSSFWKIVNDCFRAPGLRPGPLNQEIVVNATRQSWARLILQDDSMKSCYFRKTIRVTPYVASVLVCPTVSWIGLYKIDGDSDYVTKNKCLVTNFRRFCFSTVSVQKLSFKNPNGILSKVAGGAT